MSAVLCSCQHRATLSKLIASSQVPRQTAVTAMLREGHALMERSRKLGCRTSSRAFSPTRQSAWLVKRYALHTQESSPRAYAMPTFELHGETHLTTVSHSRQCNHRTCQHDHIALKMASFCLVSQVSSKDECFLDLSVDIEQNSSITQCLRSFSETGKCLIIYC